MSTLAAASGIEDLYVARTPGSRALMARARQVLPGGNTRTFGYFEPYPLVFERGEGIHLWDVDGHRYTDFTYNGLSLIHGHAFPPVLDALNEAIGHGTAWPGASINQIAFAERLCSRLPCAEQLRFTNTGTEATMLAVKLARHAMERELVLKFRGAYHGSYDDLEAGLYGIGDLKGRTLLADFGDLTSVESTLLAHKGEVAAVVIEPILFTFRVTPPPEGFLAAVIELAREHDVLSILDDCLMFRLAPGGSAERYGLRPDITCLGKFVGGGLPVGVVASSAELMSVFDPRHPRAVYHGGSFNGNPLGCTAGLVTLEHLTAESIARMNDQTYRLRSALTEASARTGVQLQISGEGSVFGVRVLGSDGNTDQLLCRRFHLAAVNRGVYFGHDGEFALATAFTDDDLATAIELLELALADLASDTATKGATP